MKVTIKKDEQFNTKVGLDFEVVIAQMESILKHNKNLCLNCNQIACLGIVNIQDPMVKKGIRTKNQDYVFDCDGYEKIQSDVKTVENNIGKNYRLNHPIIR